MKNHKIIKKSGYHALFLEMYGIHCYNLSEGGINYV